MFLLLKSKQKNGTRVDKMLQKSFLNVGSFYSCFVEQKQN